MGAVNLAPMTQLLQAVNASSGVSALDQMTAELLPGHGSGSKRARQDDGAGLDEQHSPGRLHAAQLLTGRVLAPPPPLAVASRTITSGSDSQGDDSPTHALPAGPTDRMHATKEKNRRAQQRFRLRQKEKMVAMELENARLRQLLAEHGIRYTPLPLGGVGVGGGLGAPVTSGAGGVKGLPGGGGSMDAGVGAVPGAQVAAGPLTPASTPTAAAAAALAAAAAAGPSALPPPAGAVFAQPQPCLATMYDELEGALEGVPGLNPRVTVAYLQAWVQELSDDQKRVHHRAVMKRAGRGDSGDVKLWVESAVNEGLPAQRTAVAAAAAAAAAASSSQQQQVAATTATVGGTAPTANNAGPAPGTTLATVPGLLVPPPKPLVFTVPPLGNGGENGSGPGSARAISAQPPTPATTRAP